MRPSSLARSLLMTAVPVALVGCAAASGSRDESIAERTTSVASDCFTVSLANDFRYLDDRNLIVYGVGRDAYHIELAQTCFGLRGESVIGLRSRTDRMCGFAGDAVIVDSGIPERCSVLNVRRLDEEQLRILVDQFDADGPDDGAIEVEVAELPEDDDGAEADDETPESRTEGDSSDRQDGADE